MHSKILLLLFSFSLALLFSNDILGQVTVTVRVNSGWSNSDCDDFIGASELHWQVEIAGQGNTTYPSAGICFRNPPHTQYSESFNCPSYPSQLQVCFRAFEDDGGACIVNRTCLSSICGNFNVPTPGNSATYNLTRNNQSGNDSWGSVNFTITTSGSYSPGSAYDNICNAINLNTLPAGGSLGNSGLSNYGNFCAGNAGDPNPWGGNNDQGVWFRFTTSANPGTTVSFDANSDPQNFGNDIDLQLALYESSNNLCTGGLTLVKDEYQGLGLADDEDMDVSCLKPNTTYYLLVDGERTAVINPNGQEGYFGLRITDNGTQQTGNDLICNAVNLGTLPSGGNLGNPGLSNYNNFCAGNAGEPNPNGWNDQGVWFRFTTSANPSAEIEIEGYNDPQSLGDIIDMQLELYESSNGTCSGSLTLVADDFDPVIYGEEMGVTCLKPNTTYFLLVDGDDNIANAWNGQEGYFGLQIRDLGIAQAGDLICDAEFLGAVPHGGSVGTAPGSQSNECATNTNDPTPAAWGSDKTVWYRFQAPPSGHVLLDANSNGLLSNPIDLQLAVYGTTTNLCTGLLQHLESDYTPGLFDEDMEVRCLVPGQNYWVLVDGSSLNTAGIFDLTITDGGIFPAPNDRVCDAKPLGQPAPGGTVGLNDEHNYCADNLFEPIPINWGNNQGVWYTFIAPPSGKVEVRASNPGGILNTDRIDLQLAVYDMAGAVCTGIPTELKSEFDGAGVVWGEDMEVECLIPGREYWILVDGEASLIDPDLAEGIFDIEVYGDPRDPPAPNDLVCNALALGDPTGGSVSTTPGPSHGSQNNYCATATGEPQPSNFTADQTVWYTFIAPSTGSVEIDIDSDPLIGGTDRIDLQLAVYDAASCAGPFQELISGEDLLNYDVDKDLWCLVPGREYFIQVDGAPPVLLGGHEGYFDITITEIPPIPVSPNDTICGAIALGNPWTSGTISLGGQHNLCAQDWGDPNPAAFGTDQTVWYTFTTPATGGPFAIDVSVSSDLPWPFGTDAVDLQLAVFESSNNTCTGSLTEMGSGYNPALPFPAVFNENLNVRCLEEGKTYFIMVDGSILNIQGYFDISISSATPVPIPANDLICNHEDLGTVPIGGSLTPGTDFSNFCSDVEPGEPSPYLDGIAQTVWFSFIAPNHAGANATSNVTVSVESDPNGLGDLVDLQLAVFESSNNACNGTLTLLEDGDSDPAFSFDVDVSVTCLTPGQRYWVQVDGSILNQEGYFHISVTDDGAGIRPPYNMMCNAINLGAVPNGGAINNGVNYTNLCSDTEPGEPDPSAFGIEKTVWFTFTAPSSGNVTIDALNDPNNLGDEIDIQLALYYSDDNTCTGSMVEVDSDYDFLSKDETLTIDCLTEGRIYFLQVDGAGGLLGDDDGYFTLTITDDGGVSNFPYNNDICNAYDFGIPGAIQTLTNETNVCANVQTGEVGVPGYATHTVWYQFTAPPSGRVEIEVTSTDLFGLDPEVYIFASSNNTCTGTFSQSESSFWPGSIITENIEATCLMSGETYFIQVDGSNLLYEGTFDISIEDMIPTYGTGAPTDPEPVNNGCDDAIPLAVQPESCLHGAGNFQQLGYGQPTISQPTPSINCDGNCGDTWYQFTMPSTGVAVIEGNGDNVPGLGDFSNFVIAAYSGGCSNLTPLNCQLEQSPSFDDISYQVVGTPGSTVWVQVFNQNGIGTLESNQYEICISEGCGFDDCLASLTQPMLANVPYCFNTAGANPENVSGGEPGYIECSENDNPEHSVYYHFISDCNGSDVTLHVINAIAEGGCFLSTIPDGGFNISLFQDATPCDGTPDSLVDCQLFTTCDGQPFNWVQSYTNLVPNTPYVIQIDGGSGSSEGASSGEIMITTTTNPFLAPVSTPVTCSGINDGTASAATSGGVPPYTFMWNTGQTDSTITNLAPGNYQVTITGTNGCFDTASVVVDDGILVTASIASSTSLTCNSVCDGDATVIGAGGVVATTHTYLWEAAAGSQTTATATGLCAGTYTVSAYDDGGCYGIDSIEIMEPTPIAITIINPIDTDCDSTSCTGGATASVTGGTGAYNYLWSSGETDATATALCPGDASVTVSDASGCADSTTLIIIAPTYSTSPSIAPMPGTHCPNTTLTLTASGGTAGTGSNIVWYTGPNGTGTLLGTGNNVNIATDTTTTYYVRREGACGVTADSSVVINVKHYVYAADGTSTNTYCTDNAGWHHFFVGDEIIYSVQGDLTGAPVGSPTVTIWDSTDYYQETEGPSSPVSCANGWSPGEERFEMERSWNLNFGGGTLNPPYNVRFYYQPVERSAIENAAIAHMATYPACGYSYKYGTPLGFYWFKNSSADYDAAQFDGIHLPGAIGSTNNGVNYTELTGVTNFSGGSGAVILTPITLLPVDWLYFDGTTDNNTNFLTWGTESEDNSSHFNILKSKDAINFEKIGTVQAQGNSLDEIHYSFDDENPFVGQNYYQLELVDKNGKVTLSNILMLNVVKEQTAYSFYPN
ncbi:MAG: hypothetical protein GY810_31225, partial [Aureispira sp.]|nr:hypothetical protein [Aureispira sp.]